MKKNAIKFLLLGVIIFISGCSTTDITGVWKDPDYKDGPIQSALVVGVSEDQLSRNLFESSMSTALEQKGVRTVTSAKALEKRDMSKENLMAAAQEQNLQTIVVTRIVGVQQGEVYTPPSVYSVPDPYYRRWDTYYPRTRTYMYTPGQYTSYTSVNLETNVYNVKDQSLIWSAASETFDPQQSNRNKVVDELVKKLVNQLTANKLM